MIIQELINETTIRTYSDSGFYIHGGFPEGNYAEAIDPVSANRQYTETNIPIIVEEPDNSIDSEYAEVGRILMGVSN